MGQNLAKRINQMQDAFFSEGVRVGIQFNNDLMFLVLNDPEYMGKDVSGAKRLQKLHEAVERAGDYFADMPELQGKLKLSVARYLHLETDLFLNTFEVVNAPNAVNATPYKVTSSAGMHQRRRMRSNELHFIDSPYLGLLIKIDRTP